MYNRTPATPSHPHRKPLLFLLPLLFACLPAAAQAKPAAAPEKIIIDTDIGDDLDDAFAVGLALHSPELQLLGITTTFGDTELRARLLDRFLGALGRPDIPVAAGTPTHVTNVFTQRAYALGAYPGAGRTAPHSHPAAVDFLAQQINLYPGQITLIAIGPLVNVGALIDQHPETFRKLKRVVLMGGSIYRGYGDYQYLPPRNPQPEWNILNDIPSARKLFASGVPLFVMPLDSTMVQLDEVKRHDLFRTGTPLTDQLTLLYHQWGDQTPTLFDVMTIAYVLDPTICPVEPLHLRIDDKGATLPEPGTPNAQVCLHSNKEAFFRLLMPRIAAPE